MIVDLRTYTIKPGKMADFLALYEREGFAVQKRHLGEPVGYFVSEIGDLNQVVHIWKYASMAERETKRAGMEADPEWNLYRKHSAEAGYLHTQKNQILKSVPFSPL